MAHGTKTEAPIDPELRRNLDAMSLPQGGELLRYLDGLRRSDEMLQILLSEVQHRHRDAVLAFYGDHLPSLPRAFHNFGFDEWGKRLCRAAWDGIALATPRVCRRIGFPRSSSMCCGKRDRSTGEPHPALVPSL